MNKAMDYIIACADKGDLNEFIKNCDKHKECIYRGDNGLNLHIYRGEIVKVTHMGINLKVVEL